MSENLSVVLVGQMARDDALAARLQGSQIHAVSQSENPGLIEKVEASRGQFFRTKDICNGEVVAAFAQDVFDGHKGPKLVYVGADDPLANGVIDRVQHYLPDVMTVGPKKEAARLEWDKFLTREIIDEINPKYNPKYFAVTDEKKLKEAVDFFRHENLLAVVKPRNLAGGKGVKVMSEHLKTYEKVEKYGKEVLANPKQTGASIEEEIEGEEFTIQAWTDGKILILPSTTYDFPFREDGDSGPPTGGMGSFTMKDGLMPFLTQDDYDESIWVMQEVLKKMAGRGHTINGVLYGSFFKTRDGQIRVTEFNVRGGDPELVNTTEQLDDDVDMATALVHIATGELQHTDIHFKNLASTLIYLAAPDYAYGESDKIYKFEMNLAKMLALGVRTYFAGAENIGGNRYRVGSSRAAALIALADTPWEARAMILDAKASSVEGPLRHRLDPGSKTYIESLPRAA